ncbi:Protein kinase-like (PK-like), partial [Apiospora saccharicola]
VGTRKFLSLDAQEEILNVDSVRRDLARSLTLGPTELDELVAFICPGKRCGSGSRGGKKLFAVLSLIDQLSSILVFKKEGIDDSHLPFKRHGAELIPSNYNGSLELFQGWRSKAMMDFENYQWYTLTPFLQPWKLYLFEDGVILPWTQCELVAEGGQSYVYKEGSTYFALKQLKSTERSVFDGERDGFRKSGQHRHLTELLTSFQHRDHYYLLFPWAYGGTLDNLWELSPNDLTYVDNQWVAQQVHGLVDGLSRVHYVKSHQKDAKKGIEAVLDDKQEDDDKIFGRHGDIKRDNILLFQPEHENEAVLKISDFGLTVFHSNMSKSTDRPGSVRPCGLAYRAPEAEAERSDNRMSPPI